MYLCAEVYRISFTQWLMWDEGDRQKAIAWEIRRRETCQHCGTRNSDWQSGERPFKPEKVHCIGCRESEKVQKSIPDKARGWTRVILRKVGGQSGRQ